MTMYRIELRGLALPLGGTIPIRSGFSEYVAPDALADMLRLRLPCSLLLGAHDGPAIASTDMATLELFTAPDGLYFSADIWSDTPFFHALGANVYSQCSVNFVDREYEIEADGTETVTSAVVDHIALVESGCAYGGHVGAWNANRIPDRLRWYAQRWEMAYRTHRAARAATPEPKPRAPQNRSTFPTLAIRPMQFRQPPRAAMRAFDAAHETERRKRK